MGVLMKGHSLTPTSVEIHHPDSGAIIRTTAPKDNGGDGSQFSPTDLCAASLAACATTIMGMAAQRAGFSIEVSFTLEKIMQANPRQIRQLKVEYIIRGAATAEQKRLCEDAGRTCPVRLTLGNNAEIVETYDFIEC